MSLCLFHQGIVKPAARTKLLPDKCDRCRDTVLRGDAPPEQIEEVLRDSSLWAEEERCLP